MAFRTNNVEFDVIDTTEHQKCILIAEDTLRTRLQPHLDSLKKPRDIIGAIALAVTLITSLLSIKGMDSSVTFFRGSVSKETLTASLFIFSAASVMYLIYTIYNFFKYSPNLDDIVRDIKQEQMQ